jgi:LemA protein
MGITVAVGAFFILAVLVLFGIGIGIYNNLVSLRNQVDRSWANIDVILKQRFDEIPQLVQVVEQTAKFEKGIIEKVTTARTRYGTARNTREKVAAAQAMSVALQGVMAIGEAYPELKANANFVQLQSRVSQLENDIADRRETFNEAVTNFNTRTQQFPDLLFAGMLGYRPMELLRAAPHETARPNLQMNLG